MWNNEYVIYGYNNEGKVVMCLKANALDGIRRIIGEMYCIDIVKRISIQANGEEPMKVKESAGIDEKFDNIIDNLKTTNKELSKICNAICMK